MILYEVNIQVDQSIQQEFSTWLSTHVQEMLEFKGFIKAKIFENAELKSSSHYHFVSHYYIDDIVSLNDYFNHHADRMRKDGIHRFGDKINANRRVLEIVQTF